MSGGHWDYIQYEIMNAADILASVECQYEKAKDFANISCEVLLAISSIVKHLDFAESQDTTIETAISRIKEDLDITSIKRLEYFLLSLK